MGTALGPDITLPGIKTGEINVTNLNRACANVLVAKFAAGLFDGALPDPKNAVVLNSKEHRALARQAATEGAVLLVNNPASAIPKPASETKRKQHARGTRGEEVEAAKDIPKLALKSAAAATKLSLPLEMSMLKKVAIIGPNSGCAKQGPSPPPPTPAGQCSHTVGIDCPGNDVKKVDNVSTWEDCCKLCLAEPQCITAVLATDAVGGQCIMKSACNSPTTMPSRVVVYTGRTPPPSPPGSQNDNAWNCLALRSMIG